MPADFSGRFKRQWLWTHGKKLFFYCLFLLQPYQSTFFTTCSDNIFNLHFWLNTINIYFPVICLPDTSVTITWDICPRYSFRIHSLVGLFGSINDRHLHHALKDEDSCNIQAITRIISVYSCFNSGLNSLFLSSEGHSYIVYWIKKPLRRGDLNYMHILILHGAGCLPVNSAMTRQNPQCQRTRQTTSQSFMPLRTGGFTMRNYF